MKCLKHPAAYLRSTASYAVAFEAPVSGCGVLVQDGHEGKELLELFTDADWSGDKQSRRSTSCGYMFLNKHLLYSSSRAQKGVSLSSCESEYQAAVSGACDMIFVSAAVEFLFRCEVDRRLLLDSAAARGVMARAGVGGLKHVAGKLLWIQSKIKSGVLRAQPVCTDVNPADLGTKSLGKARVKGLLNLCNQFDVDEGDFVGVLEGKGLWLQSQAKKEGKRIGKVASIIRGYGQQPHALRQPNVGALFAALAAVASSLQGCDFITFPATSAAAPVVCLRLDILLAIFLVVLVWLAWFSRVSISRFSAAFAAFRTGLTPLSQAQLPADAEDQEDDEDQENAEHQTQVYAQTTAAEPASQAEELLDVSRAVYKMTFGHAYNPAESAEPAEAADPAEELFAQELFGDVLGELNHPDSEDEDYDEEYAGPSLYELTFGHAYSQRPPSDHAAEHEDHPPSDDSGTPPEQRYEDHLRTIGLEEPNP
jgi:hypothetical protein